MKKNSRAFTLIEVLIALLIIAIALSAAIRATNASIRTTQRVQNVTVAHFVAMNILSEIQTGIMTLGESNNTLHGETNMLNQQWQWIAVLRDETAITVTVSQKKHALNSVTGYIQREKT